MAASKTIGFGVVCPYCLDAEATLYVDLNDVEAITCSCGETFSPREARDKAAEVLAKWTAVCRWIEMAKDVATAK